MPCDWSRERTCARRGQIRVAGVDEAGRGPLAGPVVAAAVIFAPRRIPKGLNDSKQLPRAVREDLHDRILAVAEVGIGIASVAEIDTINILRASHLAMQRALACLAPDPHHVLIDGNLLPRGMTLSAEAVIGGDALSVSIAAASIIAKVTRDRIMVDLAQQHPGYGWETNMGYGAPLHLRGLGQQGVTPHHRRSFAPVHNILYQAEIATP